MEGNKRNLIYTVLIIIFLIILCGIGNQLNNTTTKKQTQPTMTPFQSCLCCTEKCKIEMAGMKINLWKHPDRNGVESQVPADIEATIIDSMEYDGVLHYHIKTTWGNGWVSHFFIDP
jgi:hypothetical protein